MNAGRDTAASGYEGWSRAGWHTHVPGLSDMQRYAELVRSGAGEAERLDLLRRHREEVRRALAAQRECLKLLNSKIDIYSRRVREARTR